MLSPNAEPFFRSLFHLKQFKFLSKMVWFSKIKDLPSDSIFFSFHKILQSPEQTEDERFTFLLQSFLSILGTKQIINDINIQQRKSHSKITKNSEGKYRRKKEVVRPRFPWQYLGWEAGSALTGKLDFWRACSRSYLKLQHM